MFPVSLGKGPAVSRRYAVIDSDAHVNPLPSFWAQYLPKRYQDRAPKLEETDAGDFVVFEGKLTPFTRIASQAGTRPEEQKAIGRLRETRPGAWDAGARLSDMDIDGVDAAAIFGGGPLGAEDPELYLASFHAYNAWLGDFRAESPDRFLGMAYVPMFNVDAAIEELKWAAAQGLKGAVIPPYAPAAGYAGGALNASNLIMFAEPDTGRSYADPEFEPFWSTAVDLGIPVHVHLGATRPPAVMNAPDSRFRYQMRSKLVMAEVVTHFIMAGILPKHRDLKLVSVESGVGWFAFCAEYMDNTWRKHRFSANSPITVEPSTYMDQVYGTFLEDHAGVNNRNLKGARNIMWSSDYPHSETTWPHSREAIARSFKDVPEVEKEKLVSGNARRLYGL